MSTLSLDQARAFIQQPAPTYDTYQTWRIECLAFGAEAVVAAFESLQAGSSDGLVQETAIYVLNEFGYKVYDNERYGCDDFTYFVKPADSDTWEEIKPKVPRRDVDREQYDFAMTQLAISD